MSEDVEARIKGDFEVALDRVKNLPDQPPTTLLKLYALYKQALQGDVTGKRPGRLDFRGRAKYDAWASKKGLSREEAMKAYTALVEKLEGS
ncbi:MAG: acyl-CoA-binding protein [Candidatus Heimdallarchaeota archaeon]